MKKFIAILLCLSMLLCVAAMLASCDKDGDAASTTVVTTTRAKLDDDDDDDDGDDGGTTAATTTVATTASIPDGYKLFANNDISFVYPEDWSKTDGSITIFQGSGGSITFSYESKTDVYDNMTAYQFEQQMDAMYEQMGWDISNVTAETRIVGGLSVKVFAFDNELQASGVTLFQCLYTFNTGDKTYAIAITETVVDTEFRAAVLNSIKVVDQSV